MKKRAFISVSDKSGITNFAKGLIEAGFEVVSTGGTAKTLAQAGIDVVGVSDITGFPECLDGRVKTLHPMIHGGILAMRSNKEHMEQISKLGITPFDVICVNLYPFKETIMKPGVTLEEAIENIDIGGPSMLRAAAKNWQDVAAVTDSADYSRVLDQLKGGGISRETKFELCLKVFEHTAAYDAMIASYLRKQAGGGYPKKLTLTFDLAQQLRYGENPHQSAVYYHDAVPDEGGLHQAEQLNGKELSFNNINDANGALALLSELKETAAVAVKHANPCGVAIGKSVYEAYVKAYESDPVSIFGGIVALNGTVDAQTAAKMAEIFLEIIIAPDYTQEALDILRKKPNLRVLRLPLENLAPKLDIKRVAGGLLVQDADHEDYAELQTVTKRKPDKKEMDDLLFAWKVVKHVKSNGIAIAKDGCSLGIGPGQVNRIWAAEMALERSGERVRGAVMASDAFFPFEDCVQAAAKYGITAIIQPGGSVRDKESIDACDKHGIAMVFTDMRHFKH
ncbi:MAG: bifunctional phosphoribosylaminoimidazolecarboxamide formyltransferase/IMP cyclohydrolase [Christensenellales bacterium]|jgi:phosphoribosylaminoimidazolecarboxamide formyltransferase/IMP cyclohydrolase